MLNVTSCEVFLYGSNPFKGLIKITFTMCCKWFLMILKMLKKKMFPEEIKSYLGINSDTTLRKREKAGLKIRRDKNSNRKYCFEEDLIRFLNL